MPITDTDLALFARRARLNFPAPLQNAAERFTFSVAQFAGSKAKQLRPETPLKEILEWIAESPLLSDVSPDAVECLVVLESELATHFPDSLVSDPQSSNALHLVQYVAAKHTTV